MKSDERLCHDLTRHVPPLEPILVEHIDDYGELLPSLFLGEVGEHLYELCERGDDAAWRQTDEILQFAEAAWAEGDEQVQVLLATCLLENLQDFEQRCPAVVDHLGPVLRKEFRKICPWAPRKPRRSHGRRL